LDADFAIAARLAGLGDLVIMTWVTRGDAPRLLGGLAGLARKALLRSVQHVVLTPSMENELHSLNVAHVSVVPVPVDTSWFHVPTETERSTARRSLGVSSGTVVLFVGHLTPRKGVERLVEAVAQLSEPEGGVRLFIVGGPPRAPDRAYAEQLLQEVERRLGSWAVFWGPRDDVRPFFHAADIFCLPSYSEGMPNCLLEAMASGVACVAPPSAGGAELLGGNLGVVPPSNSPEDLRMALAYLIEHAEERLAMGSMASGAVQVANRPERAVALYEALWDWDRTVAAARNGGAASKG
jgi:glycosyltransferase involved in cell wall biosynthesis